MTTRPGGSLFTQHFVGSTSTKGFQNTPPMTGRMAGGLLPGVRVLSRAASGDDSKAHIRNIQSHERRAQRLQRRRSWLLHPGKRHHRDSRDASPSRNRARLRNVGGRARTQSATIFRGDGDSAERSGRRIHATPFIAWIARCPSRTCWKMRRSWHTHPAMDREISMPPPRDLSGTSSIHSARRASSSSSARSTAGRGGRPSRRFTRRSWVARSTTLLPPGEPALNPSSRISNWCRRGAPSHRC